MAYKCTDPTCGWTGYNTRCLKCGAIALPYCQPPQAETDRLRKGAEAAYVALRECVRERWDECLVERAYHKLREALHPNTD